MFSLLLHGQKLHRKLCFMCEVCRPMQVYNWFWFTHTSTVSISQIEIIWFLPCKDVFAQMYSDIRSLNQVHNGSGGHVSGILFNIHSQGGLSVYHNHYMGNWNTIHASGHLSLRVNVISAESISSRQSPWQAPWWQRCEKAKTLSQGGGGLGGSSRVGNIIKAPYKAKTVSLNTCLILK